MVILGCLGVQFFVFEGANAVGNQVEIDELNVKISEKKAKIQELEQSIQDFKNKIAQKQLESKSLKNQMSILDNRISQVQTDVQATEESLDATLLEIKSLSLSIQDKESALSRQKGIVAEMLRDLYHNSGQSYLRIASTYNNFSDFYNKVQYLQTVERELGNNIHALRLTKEGLDREKSAADLKKLAYDTLKSKLLNKKQDLQEDMNVRSNLLTQTKSSEKIYTTQLANLKKQEQAIEDEMSAIEKEVRRKLQEQGKLKLIDDNKGFFSWPVPSHYITCYFHDPEYPFRNVFEHTGLDMRASFGTPVKAAGSGYIARAKRCTTASCYSYAMIVHDGGLATVYGHLSSIIVNEDQFVTRGDVIGYSGGAMGAVGSGPFATGPHLHFEVRRNGIAVDPMGFLQ